MQRNIGPRLPWVVPRGVLGVIGCSLLAVSSSAQPNSPGFPSLAPPAGAMPSMHRPASYSAPAVPQMPPGQLYSSPVGPATAPVTEGEAFAPQKLIADVLIRGNEATTENFVQAQLKSRKDREFDPEVVQADVRRLASTGRFRDVRTYVTETPAGVVVTFEVFERPTVRYIRYLGNRGISDKTLSKQDGLEVDDPLNRYAVEEARRKIEEYYHSKGFSKTQISVLEGNKPQDQGAVFVVNEGVLERILDVNFVGNTITSDSRLKTQIKSKPGLFWLLFGGKFDRQKIDQDIEHLTAYYRNLGFFNARVGRELEFSESGKWLTITFVIDEGPRYVVRNVSVVGARKFADEDLLAQLDLQSGEFFNLGELNRDVSRLRDIYGQQGHIFADIAADPRFLEEPGHLDLVYNIDEGGAWRVGEINVHIRGEHPHTRESVVVNLLGDLRPGALFDSRAVRSAERRLMSCQLFENNPANGSTPQVVIHPPELQDLEEIARRGSGGTYRGQGP